MLVSELEKNAERRISTNKILNKRDKEMSFKVFLSYWNVELNVVRFKTG